MAFAESDGGQIILGLLPSLALAGVMRLNFSQGKRGGIKKLEIARPRVWEKFLRRLSVIIEREYTFDQIGHDLNFDMLQRTLAIALSFLPQFVGT